MKSRSSASRRSANRRRRRQLVVQRGSDARWADRAGAGRAAARRWALAREIRRKLYGTRGGPFKPGGWGASTCQGDQIYLYVMQWPADGGLLLPALPCRILESESPAGGRCELSRQTKELSSACRQRIARMSPRWSACEWIRRQFVCRRSVWRGAVRWRFRRIAPRPTCFRTWLTATGRAMALDDDADTCWATDGGTHQAWLEVDLDRPTRISRVMIDEVLEHRIRKFELQAQEGQDLADDSLGRDRGTQFHPHVFPSDHTARPAEYCRG